MKSENLFCAMNGVDPRLIAKAEPVRRGNQAQKRRAYWIKLSAVAACFVLVLSICLVPMLDFSDPSELSDYHFMLALTVHAADGTAQSMELDQTILQSSVSGINAFGKDVPTFEFYVAPVEQGEEDIFEKYYIEISYGGKVVEDKDEHIRLLYAVPGEGIYGIGRYGIIGWFEETTDIVVTLKDKNSSELIERMTVNVVYSEADTAYKLTLTELFAPDTEE